MKRTVCLFLALLLALAAPFCAAGAEGKTFATKYFTMTLPDGWETEAGSGESASKDGIEELGFFASDEETGLVVGAYLIYYDELKNVSLWDSDENELREYAEILLDEFAEDQPEWVGTVMAGSVPFILIAGSDEDGDYLYADTVTNGYSIQFEAYVADMDDKVYPLTDAHIAEFKRILETFVPVV